MGDRGALDLFGENPDRLRLLADQVTAEYAVRTSGRQRTIDEWKLRAGNPDNHLLDALVLSAVAASVSGQISLPEITRVMSKGKGRGYARRTGSNVRKRRRG